MPVHVNMKKYTCIQAHFDKVNSTLFFPEGSSSSKFLVGRRMRVNNRNILSLDYSRKSQMEKIYDDHTKFTIKVWVRENLPLMDFIDKTHKYDSHL